MSEKSVQERYAPNNACFGCGVANPKGLQIRSFEHEGGLKTLWSPQPHHQAFEGVMNGGIIGALLDWIEGQEQFRSDRVAVMGGSYGGYMVLACMVHYGDRLAAAVESVGISNFVTFLENTRDYRRDLRRVEYGDERDPKMRAFLEKIAPSNNVDKITKPLLVLQGQNDPRVPASESEQIVKAMRKAGREVWYLLAKDEGHGFRKKANRDIAFQVTVQFLQEYLLE